MSTIPDPLDDEIEKIIGWVRYTDECVMDPAKYFETQSTIRSLIERESTVTEDTSDGYHTFKELYRFRLLYNALIFNEWWHQGKYDTHKSERHSDGKLCFGGGWFVVVALLPTGQITNHYEMKDWYLFKCEIRKKAAKWDGHSDEDVIKRIMDYLPAPTTPQPHSDKEREDDE